MRTSKGKIAILICNKYYSVPTAQDNDLFLSALDKVNLSYDLVIWDQPSICWEKYSAVLIRATWDYIEDKNDKFIMTLEAITNFNIPLFNSLETVRWNSNKNYLLWLKQKNVSILDTLIISQNEPNDLVSFLHQTNDGEYVIKPVISGGSYKTYRVKPKDVQAALKMHFKKDEKIIIQPFMPEIVHEGEWSLIFFNGTYSHSVLLKPALGDFRVQIKHGGTVQIAHPSEDMLQEATRILSILEYGMPLYARVDFVLRNKQIFLMELELIEPALFFRWDPNASTHFVNALLQRISIT